MHVEFDRQVEGFGKNLDRLCGLGWQPVRWDFRRCDGGRWSSWMVSMACKSNRVLGRFGRDANDLQGARSAEDTEGLRGVEQVGGYTTTPSDADVLVLSGSNRVVALAHPGSTHTTDHGEGPSSNRR